MSQAIETVDVIIVGAGLSGIGAGVHLQDKCPDRSFLILEGRETLGGTWDLFRYPGVRSDSDMHTLGYSFKPWTGTKAITDGHTILAYIEETAADYGIDRQIRFQHQVIEASWSSEEARWMVTAITKDTGSRVTFACNFLLVCSGYYNYKAGHTPDFSGREAFKGDIVHPQHWPRDLNYEGKNVVVIGSGATAVTLVPAMAETAAHVTMLQRSPSYVVAMPDRDRVADGLRKFLPAKMAYGLTRWKNIKIGAYFYGRTRKQPEKVRKWIIDKVKKKLGPEIDVDKHFNPAYNPWDQRLCLIPNGDLFRSLKLGKASVVTESIETFTKNGIELVSGEHLDADIIVTATGLRVLALGDIDIDVDGEKIDFSKVWSYKGVAYSDLPNLVSTFGYINASWTLRADLIAAYVCRLLNHMRATGTQRCIPRLRPSDQGMQKRPLIENFSSGYIQRALPGLPSQGDCDPWTNPQSYALDKKALSQCPIDDGVMTFSRAGS